MTRAADISSHCTTMQQFAEWMSASDLYDQPLYLDMIDYLTCARQVCEHTLPRKWFETTESYQCRCDREVLRKSRPIVERMKNISRREEGTVSLIDPTLTLLHLETSDVPSLDFEAVERGSRHFNKKNFLPTVRAIELQLASMDVADWIFEWMTHDDAAYATTGYRTIIQHECCAMKEVAQNMARNDMFLTSGLGLSLVDRKTQARLEKLDQCVFDWLTCIRSLADYPLFFTHRFHKGRFYRLEEDAMTARQLWEEVEGKKESKEEKHVRFKIS